MKSKYIVTLSLALTFAMLQLSANDLIPDKNDKGKWGYVNEAGSVAIDYKYDEARNFDNGLAVVRKGENLGVINESAKEILPLKFNLIDKYNDNIFRVATGGKIKDGVLENEKYGFVDRNGYELLKPEYNEIGNFTNGIAYIRKGKNYGYINDSIRVIVPCEFNSIGSFNDDGFVWVCKLSTFYGIYNSQGKVIVPVKYKSVGPFVRYEYSPSKEKLDNMGFVRKRITLESGSHYHWFKGTKEQKMFSKMDSGIGFYGCPNYRNMKKNAVYSLTGNLLIKEGKYESAFYPTDSMMLVMDKKDNCNYLDLKTGKLLFKKYIPDGWAFEDGVAVADINTEGEVLINLKGEAISKTYYKIYPRKEGVYIVEDDKSDSKYFKYGAITPEGREIIAAKHSHVYPPSNGLMSTCERSDSTVGYIGLDGNWKIPPIYNLAYSFYTDGTAAVETDNGWGLIDTTGREIVKCRWNNIYHNDINSKYLWVTDEDGSNCACMLLNTENDTLVSPVKFKWFRHFHKDFKDVAMAGQDKDHIGIINEKCEYILPPVFNYYQLYEAYSYYLSEHKTSWEEIDTYRIKLYHNPDRNKWNLSNKIDSTLWDY